MYLGGRAGNGCGKKLNMEPLFTSHKGAPYCRPCHLRLFGPIVIRSASISNTPNASADGAEMYYSVPAEEFAGEGTVKAAISRISDHAPPAYPPK